MVVNSLITNLEEGAEVKAGQPVTVSGIAWDGGYGINEVAVSLAAAVPASADEYDIVLKPGDGLQAVEQNCAACHIPDYIQMNSPFLDRKGWEAEVAKMVKMFGAPVAEDDQHKIIDYLSAHYGKE
jgi:mono/diheme cytochrome c family protein